MQDADSKVDKCPICSGAIRLWRMKCTAFGLYEIDRCVECGFAFVNPRPALETLMSYYSQLGYVAGQAAPAPTAESILGEEQADPSSTLDAKRLAETLAHLRLSKGNPLGRLLDVGCGYGFFSLEALRHGFDVTALDPSANKREIMKAITGIEPIQRSFEDFECTEGLFSAILMSQILEHVTDVNLWIKKACSILQGEGVIAIALPNFDNAFRFVLQEKSPLIIPPEHLNYFNVRSLTLLLKRHGLIIEKVQWVTSIPTRLLRRKLPSRPSPLLLRSARLAARGVSGLMDRTRCGLTLNVYSRKPG